MKKKHAILPLLVMTVLSSCQNYGQEITDKARVAELEKAISERMNEQKGFEVYVKASMSEDRGRGNKDAYSWNFIYRGDEKDNMYFSGSLEIESSGEKAKYDYTFYLVENPEYEKVLYQEMSGGYASGKDIEVVALRSDYYSMEVGIPGILVYPIELYEEARDPYYIDQTRAEYTNTSVRKYYSKGDGSLTIEMSNSETRETTMSGRFRMTYENYLLKDAEFETKEAGAAYQNYEKIELTYKPLSNYTVTLPSGWESLIRDPVGSSYY